MTGEDRSAFSLCPVDDAREDKGRYVGVCCGVVDIVDRRRGSKVCVWREIKDKGGDWERTWSTCGGGTREVGGKEGKGKVCGSLLGAE